MTTQNKGEIAQLKCQLEGLNKGFICSIPTTEERFDLLLTDKNGKTNRAQIKYCDSEYIDNRGKQINNILRLELKGREYTNKEIDLLLIYIPRLDKILAFGPKLFHNRKRIKIHLSNKKSKNYYANFLW